VKRTRARSAWLAGLTVGVGAGALSLVIPVVGWTIGVAFLVGAVMSRAVAAGVGGFLLGGGGTWLALLAQADLRCRAATGPDRECILPDGSPWVAAAVALLVVGGLATVMALRRGAPRRRNAGGSDLD